MDTFVDFLIQFGLPGMFLAGFLAGSLVPFSSELVMAGLQLAGVDPLPLLLWGTAGNTLGSLFNYGLGRLGRPEWITRFAHVEPQKLERSMHAVTRYGGWMGLLSWVPILGGAITLAMGLLRTGFVLTFINIVVGKLIRYAIVIGAVTQL